MCVCVLIVCLNVKQTQAQGLYTELLMFFSFKQTSDQKNLKHLDCFYCGKMRLNLWELNPSDVIICALLI